MQCVISGLADWAKKRQLSWATFGLLSETLGRSPSVVH